MSRIKMIPVTLAFYYWSYLPFFLFLKLISCPLCNSNTPWNILLVFGRNVEHDETMCRVQE